ncbi:hypothetical protein CDIK_3259 [Cucumispora dikerogammari]|nr:hypothetical protein CDIK_3259 [Cucumispora dikerogammari]
MTNGGPVIISEREVMHYLQSCSVARALSKKKKKKKKAMLAVDYFSRKVYGVWIKNKKPSQTIKLLSEAATELQIKQVNMDNGREFRNALVNEWCRKREINIKYFAPHAIESNGRIERVNRIIR